MSFNTAFVKDKELQLRERGTAATATETGSGTQIKYVGATNITLRCVMSVASITISTGDSQTYVLKLQESSDGSTSWVDIQGASVDIEEVGNIELHFKLSENQDYVRHVLTIGGTSTSVDGDIYVTQE